MFLYSLFHYDILTKRSWYNLQMDLSDWSKFENNVSSRSSLTSPKPIKYRRKHPKEVLNQKVYPITENLTAPTKLTGKGIVRPELKMFLTHIKGETKDMEVWRRYRRAYQKIPIVAAAIDVTVDNAIQSFYVTKGVEEYKEEINELKAKFNLTEFFYNVAKQMLIFGNCFVELVKDEEGIKDLKILDPITIFVNRDEYGNFSEDQEDAYLQYLPHQPTKPITFRYDEIVHFKWNPIGETAYGNSIIHPLMMILQVKINTEHNLDIILNRYAAPLHHVKVGSPERPASQSEIDSLSSDLEDIQADTELVTDDRVEIEVLGAERKALNLSPQLEYLENQVIAGLQTPLVFLGRGDIDRAAAETQLDMFDRRAKTLQRTIKRIAEIQIFKVHLELLHGKINDKDVPELSWGEPQQRQSREDIRLVIEMKNAGIITAQKANDQLPEEYQEKLPEQLKNPNPQGMGNKSEEPSLKRVQTARDKRNPKKQEEK